MLLPFVLATALHITALPAADSLSGTWRFSGDVVGNPVNELCTLKLTGTAVTGSCTNTDAADAKPFDVTGDVKEGKITIRHGGEYQGQALTLTYTGTLTAPNALKGTIDVQPFGVTGEFTAAPATPTPAPAR